MLHRIWRSPEKTSSLFLHPYIAPAPNYQLSCDHRRSINDFNLARSAPEWRHLAFVLSAETLLISAAKCWIPLHPGGGPGVGRPHQAQELSWKVCWNFQGQRRSGRSNRSLVYRGDFNLQRFIAANSGEALWLGLFFLRYFWGQCKKLTAPRGHGQFSKLSAWKAERN